MASHPKDNPIIGTEIFDVALPSELLDSTALESSKAMVSSIPLQSPFKGPSTKSHSYLVDGTIESFTVKGKSIFKQTPSYQSHQTISISLPTLEAKFPSEGNSGIKGLWEKVVGNCKRELYLNEGFIYVLEKRGSIGYYIHKVLPLDDIFKVFYDKETQKVRLVFVTGTITETKDFVIVDKGAFFTRLNEEMNKIGRQM